jgi:hypothetical protein
MISKNIKGKLFPTTSREWQLRQGWDCVGVPTQVAKKVCQRIVYQVSSLITPRKPKTLPVPKNHTHSKKKSKTAQVFMTVAVDTSGRIYDDFSHLLFLYAHREASALANEIPEESYQFRFLRAACFTNIKGPVGLILDKTSDMRISIPLDLSSRSFIPLPRFIRSRRATPLLAPSLVFSPRRSA